MENLSYILVIALHIFTIYDALRYLRNRNGGLRVLLAFIPPILGPIIYWLTKNGSIFNQRERVFMKRKRRFS
ncbi:hypothetical protein [Perlabentimonas gracilis]|uniref:hypothetical protein n=1 Tax=Perlabentimonas gracilis TaxID=2715279 RepID=UPI001407D99E|nr:hypothetical protein [Perlabentimonas gracilis]NHB67410.1 hypothetical protein [Perlabentimonas gracilis]